MVLSLISLWSASSKHNTAIGVMHVSNIGKFLGDLIFTYYILTVNDKNIAGIFIN